MLSRLIFSRTPAITALRRKRRAEHVRDHGDRLQRAVAHRPSLQRPALQQLQVDLRDLGQQRLVALRDLHVRCCRLADACGT